MPISVPKLTPKPGYVEVVDSTGAHIYKPTKETEDRLALEDKVEKLSSILGISQSPTPSQLDRLEAQAAYTAMMTNTLLPEG